MINYVKTTCRRRVQFIGPPLVFFMIGSMFALAGTLFGQPEMFRHFTMYYLAAVGALAFGMLAHLYSTRLTRCILWFTALGLAVYAIYASIVSIWPLEIVERTAGFFLNSNLLAASLATLLGVNLLRTTNGLREMRLLAVLLPALLLTGSRTAISAVILGLVWWALTKLSAQAR